MRLERPLRDRVAVHEPKRRVRSAIAHSPTRRLSAGAGGADAYELADATFQSTTPFSTPILDEEVPLFDAVDVFENTKDDVGCSMPVRDAYDMVRISDIENREQTYGRRRSALARQ